MYLALTSVCGLLLLMAATWLLDRFVFQKLDRKAEGSPDITP